MIYLDTSCLLKLLRHEPESPDIRSAVDAEDVVIVSPWQNSKPKPS
jgi:uncharacterized protein with PIN domain